MNYKEDITSISMWKEIEICETDIYQIQTNKEIVKKIDPETGEEYEELITVMENKYGDYENFNQFFNDFNDNFNNFNKAMDCSVDAASEDEINESLRAADEFIQKLILSFKDTNIKTYIETDQFLELFDSLMIISNFIEYIDLSKNYIILSSETETIKSELIEKMLHFLAISSFLSPYIANCLNEAGFISIFLNTDNLDLYTNQQINEGIAIMNSIFKGCSAEFLLEAINSNYIEFLLSKIQGRESPDPKTKEIDNSLSTTLATYFMRALQLDSPEIKQLFDRFISTFQTLDIVGRGKIVFLIYNLMIPKNPQQFILKTQELSKITLPNNQRLLINIFGLIGNADYDISLTALKIAIFFFDKNVFSPKQYYKYALGIPFSTIKNKIISSEQSSPFAIKLLLTLILIDQREVDPQYKPDEPFYDLIERTRIIDDIGLNYDLLDYQTRHYAINLFIFLCLYGPDQYAFDYIRTGIIKHLFEYLDNEDFEINKSIIQALNVYFDRTEIMEPKIREQLIQIAHDENVDDILMEYIDTEVSEIAHQLYIKLQFEDDQE